MWRVYAYYPNSDACDFWTEDTEEEAIELWRETVGDSTYSRVTYAKLTREEIEANISQFKTDAKKPLPEVLHQSVIDSIARFEKALEEYTD